jgi:hypothetical protein
LPNGRRKRTTSPPMADTHSPAHAPHGGHAVHVAHGSDMGAAFAGLIIGALALLLLLGSIVILTNRHYAKEKAAAGAER